MIRLAQIPKGAILALNIADALQDAGLVVPEKFAGFAIGPKLADGSYALLLGTDNDFSVTQNGQDVQFDVCTNGIQVTIDTGIPEKSTLIPTYFYCFKTSNGELEKFVAPELGVTAGLILLGIGGFWLKQRQS